MANEIELMVSVRRQGEAGVKRRGDVITCRQETVLAVDNV